MKTSTDQMDDEELLQYLLRVQWRERTAQAGCGLLAGSTVAYLLSLPAIACILFGSVGVCLLVVAAYLRLTEPKFVPLDADPFEEELTEEERVKRVFLSDLEIM